MQEISPGDPEAGTEHPALQLPKGARPHCLGLRGCTAPSTAGMSLGARVNTGRRYLFPEVGRGARTSLWSGATTQGLGQLHSLTSSQQLCLSFPRPPPLRSPARIGALAPSAPPQHRQGQRGLRLPPRKRSCLSGENPVHPSSPEGRDQEIQSIPRWYQPWGAAGPGVPQTWGASGGRSGRSQRRDSPQLLPAALSHGRIWGSREQPPPPALPALPPQPRPPFSRPPPKAGRSPCSPHHCPPRQDTAAAFHAPSTPLDAFRTSSVLWGSGASPLVLPPRGQGQPWGKDTL